MGFRWKKGALLSIQLGDDREAFAQMLDDPEMAFFDPDNRENVIFRLWVMRSAYTTGRWKRIGEEPVAPELETSVPRFKVDKISGSITIDQDGVIQPATAEQCLS